MAKQDKEKIEKEIDKLNQEIQSKENEIFDSSEYKEKQKNIDKLIKADSYDDRINHRNLTNSVYRRYMDNWHSYKGVRLQDVKPSVKQGIKTGLGMKNLKEIENHIVRITKGLIEEDLKNPKMEELRNKILDVSLKIDKTREEMRGILDRGLNKLREEKAKLVREVNKERTDKEKKIKVGQREADEKINNLGDYLPKIIKDINRRLILDGIKK